MILDITENYNKIFTCPIHGINKYLIFIYININDKKHKLIFEENEKINLNDIKKLVDIRYGYNDKWINVTDICYNLCINEPEPEPESNIPIYIDESIDVDIEPRRYISDIFKHNDSTKPCPTCGCWRLYSRERSPGEYPVAT
tara:strand:- start:11025 stop:11450 length:426 start_codon:yes stop_codon:yes gene_type:complete